MTEHAETRIVDFHVHYAGPHWPVHAPPSQPRDFAERWQGIAARIADVDGLLASLDAAEIDACVLGAPPALLSAPDVPLDAGTIRDINDHLLERVGAHPGRLFGLATIDAFQGETAAGEAERAVALGLGGLIVDCQRGDRLLDDPAARPALEVAAGLGVPIFVHPVSPVRHSRELAGLGRLGVSVARGTSDAASVLSLVSSGTLDEIPGLRIVIPMLGGAALLYAVLNPSAQRLRRETPPEERWHVYVDTMGFAAPAIRFAADVVGADHLLAGSDWPIWEPDATRAVVVAALIGAGLDDSQIQLVAGGNALALLSHEVVA
jgi:predicted TIM-barrel fold metal-dependent hydrolase